MRYIFDVTALSSADPNDLLPLPVAMFHILVAVADQDRHGYAIMQDVAARTNGALKLSPGTLYGSIDLGGPSAPVVRPARPACPPPCIPRTCPA
jgi:hypothetical protein